MDCMPQLCITSQQLLCAINDSLYVGVARTPSCPMHWWTCLTGKSAATVAKCCGDYLAQRAMRYAPRAVFMYGMALSTTRLHWLHCHGDRNKIAALLLARHVDTRND
eukprot:scaffold406020_cov20-Prasinocladus_malaysianus.AAC.1